MHQIEITILSITINLDLNPKDVNYLNAVFTKPTAQEEVFFPLSGVVCV